MFRASLLALLALCGGCQPGADPGRPCARASDCSSPLVCAVGHCRAACRSTRDCPIEQHCLVDPTTQTPACSLPADDCADRVCAAGFVCIDGLCLNACDHVTCPDAVCADGACIPIRNDDALVTVPDGGVCVGPSCDPIVQLVANSDPKDNQSEHVCVRTQAGAVYCWGVCSSGECGDGLTNHGACMCSGAPMRVLDETGAPLVGATHVAATATSTCVVRGQDGELWCVGSGPHGHTTVLTRVASADGSPLTGVTAVAGGGGHVCVLRGAATQPLCFGTGASGQLGTGMASDAMAPVPATLLPATSHMVLEEDRTIVMDAAGMLVGVGGNYTFQLGTTTPMTTTTMPVTSAFPAAIAFDTYGEWTAAVLTDGRIAVCGQASEVLGPMGVGMPGNIVTPLFVPVPSGVEAVGIAMGHGGAAVWARDGSLWAWGRATSPITTTPVAVDTGGRHVASAIFFHDSLCFLASDGEVLCRGENERGMLGRGETGPYDPSFAHVHW